MVLDANIFIRAVLGSRVLSLLREYSEVAEFAAPDTAFQEARENLPGILKRRGVPENEPMALLASLETLVRMVDFETYSRHEIIARKRMILRDESDWPILATALALGFPIWTEDTDFFGCGVATWTTDRVELYLDVL